MGWYFWSMSHQLICHPHGQEHRHARADADDLDVRDLAQTAEQLFQHLGRQHQRIAARKQHIPHLGSALEIIDLHLEIRAGEGCRWVADDARAGAIAAVGGALGGNQHQHPVGVTMHQPGHG